VSAEKNGSPSDIPALIREIDEAIEDIDRSFWRLVVMAVGLVAFWVGFVLGWVVFS
jgi:hypothetical protein